MQNMLEIAKQAKAASVVLAQLGNVQKNQALLTIAEQLEARQAEILAANAKDIEFEDTIKSLKNIVSVFNIQNQSKKFIKVTKKENLKEQEQESDDELEL